MTFHIDIANPFNPGVQTLIEALDTYQQTLYPDESNHLDSIEELSQPNVFFVGAYDSNRDIVGCGAIKYQTDRNPPKDFGEIKRLYVHEAFRGLGISSRIMQALEEDARGRGVHILRLETGIYQPEAIGLYEKTGYQRCGAFASYSADDPYSVFMEKVLDFRS